MNKRKVWLTGVNWEKLKETGSLYEWTTGCSYYEGEDISSTIKHAYEKGMQVYIHTTRKQWCDMENQLIKVARGE